jgi:membrane associated rhomboid family serine protease
MTDDRDHGGNGKSNGSGHASAGDAGNVIDIKSMRIPAPPPANDQPVLNLPPGTKLLLIAFVVIQAYLAFFLTPAQRYDVFQTYGFVPGYYTTPMGASLWQKLCGPFTYMFVHGNWMHLILNSLMLMAFGTGVEKWLGMKKMLAFFYLSSLIAALAYFIVTPTGNFPVIGASGGLSGLFAAILVLLQKRGQFASTRYGIWPFVVLWIVISAVFGFTGGPGGTSIAWVAHIGGFLGGVALINLFIRLNLTR